MTSLNIWNQHYFQVHVSSPDIYIKWSIDSVLQYDRLKGVKVILSFLRNSFLGFFWKINHFQFENK